MSRTPGTELKVAARSRGKRDSADSREIELTNTVIVSQVLEDPDRGLALLYDKYARAVNGLVFRLLGPDAEHDDIVQQIFLQMIQAVGKLRSPEKLNIWVRSIAVNVVRSELRKRSIRRAAFLRWGQRAEPTGDLSDDVEASEFMTVSASALKRLPTQERIVFVLYYLEERSLPEIAEMCGFSTMTAKRRLSKARERFRRRMEREGAALLDARAWRTDETREDSR